MHDGKDVEGYVRRLICEIYPSTFLERSRKPMIKLQSGHPDFRLIPELIAQKR
jgi:hypothetical protein